MIHTDKYTENNYRVVETIINYNKALKDKT